METPVIETTSSEVERSVDYQSEKPSNLHTTVIETRPKMQNYQTSGKELSTFRLVLILAALWVGQRFATSLFILYLP